MPHPHPVFKLQPLNRPLLEQVTFEDGTRYYVHPQLGKLPSVTTILKILPKDGLWNWRHHLREKGVDPEERLRYTAIRGSIVHEHCARRLATISGQELVLNIEKKDEKELFSEFTEGETGDMEFEVEQADLMFEMFLEDHETFPILGGIELPTYHPDEKYAGTVDLLAVIDDKFTLLDIKTAVRVHSAHEMQIWAYRSAVESSTHLNIERVAILTLCPDLEFLGRKMNPAGSYTLKVLDRDRTKEFLTIRRKFRRETGL